MLVTLGQWIPIYFAFFVCLADVAKRNLCPPKPKRKIPVEVVLVFFLSFTMTPSARSNGLIGPDW